MPEDEIWVKIGGDKGGGSFKMNFQILNIPTPSSHQNMCILVMFQASDTTVNLHVALDRYKEDNKSLQGKKWK